MWPWRATSQPEKFDFPIGEDASWHPRFFIFRPLVILSGAVFQAQRRISCLTGLRRKPNCTTTQHPRFFIFSGHLVILTRLYSLLNAARNPRAGAGVD